MSPHSAFVILDSYLSNSRGYSIEYASHPPDAPLGSNPLCESSQWCQNVSIRPVAFLTNPTPMTTLILGLILFLGVHSMHWAAPLWRQKAISRWSLLGYKAGYSLMALLGLILVVVGYGQARLTPIVIWVPPAGMRHATLLLMWFSLVLLASAYGPANPIRARFRHPMTLSVKVWALGHLLANGNLADLLLFGGMGLWAVMVFRAARRRDRQRMSDPPRGSRSSAVLSLAVASALWLLLVMGGGHVWLTGMAIWPA